MWDSVWETPWPKQKKATRSQHIEQARAGQSGTTQGTILSHIEAFSPYTGWIDFSPGSIHWLATPILLILPNKRALLSSSSERIVVSFAKALH